MNNVHLDDDSVRRLAARISEGQKKTVFSQISRAAMFGVGLCAIVIALVAYWQIRGLFL